VTARHIRDYGAFGSLSATISAFSSADHLRGRSAPVITSIRRGRAGADISLADHYGQNDACSWPSIMLALHITRNVGAGHRLQRSARSVTQSQLGALPLQGLNEAEAAGAKRAHSAPSAPDAKPSGNAQNDALFASACV
jgi:hypothetical protein